MGNISLGRAVLVLATEMGSWVSDLDDAHAHTKKLQQAVDNVGKGVSAFGKQTAAFGGALTTTVTAPIAAAVGGLLALATQAANTGDQIKASAAAAGVGGQAYQEIGYALGQVANLSGEQVDKALKALTATIGEAATGGKKATDALLALGFTEEQIASGTITTEEAFGRMNTALQGTESTAQAVALAGDLVGSKLGKELGGILQASGAEVDVARERFRELGLGMDDVALNAADDFNDSLDTVKRQFGALATEIGSAVLPILVNEFMPWLTTTGIPLLRDFAEMIGGVVRWFADLPAPIQIAIGVIAGVAAAIGPVLVVAGTLISSVGSIISAFSAVAPIVTGAGAAIAAIGAGPLTLIVAAIAAVVVAWQNWDKIGPIVANVYNAVKEWLVDKFHAARDLIEKAVRAVVGFYVGMYAPIFKVVGDIYRAIKEYLLDKFQAIVDGVKAKIDAVTGFFKGMYDKVAGNSYVPDMVRRIGQEFAQLDQFMVAPTRTATTQVDSLFGGLLEKLTTNFLPGFSGAFTGIFEGLFGGRGRSGSLQGIVSQGLTALGNAMVPGLGTLLAQLAPLVTDFLGWIWDGFVDTMKAIGDVLGGGGPAIPGEDPRNPEQLPETPPGRPPRDGSLPEFATGTMGRYLNFGSGTDVRLHGWERIQTLGEAGREGHTTIIEVDGREMWRAFEPFMSADLLGRRRLRAT